MDFSIDVEQGMEGPEMYLIWAIFSGITVANCLAASQISLVFQAESLPTPLNVKASYTHGFLLPI